MKGFADIVLYDKEGNIIKEQHDDNFITNAFKEYLEAHNALISNPVNRMADDIRDITNGATMLKLIGGIVLFENKLPEDASIVHNDVVSVASAGTAYDYTNPLRGSLNAQETGATEINGKQAYRWVWDFGTANANCTFNTVCLSNSYAGDRSYRTFVSRDLTGDINKFRSFNHKIENFIYNNKKGITIDKYGRRISRKEDFIFIEDYVKSKKITDNGNMVEEIKISPNTHTWFSSVTHLEGDILMYIAKNIGSSEFELIKMNIVSKEIIETIELTGLKNSVTSRIDAFGFIGLNTILFNPSISNNKLAYSLFNLDTKEITLNFVTAHPVIVYHTYSGECFITSFKTVSGKYACYINHQTRPAYWSNSCCVILDKDKVISLINDQNVGDSLSYNAYYPVNRTFNNMNMCGYIDTFYSEAYGGAIWTPGIEPLFTINNLANPITKTEANTMKITYTLIFE